MTEGRAAVVLAQLLAGLAAMHAKGLVHGDIRSSNVLLARNGKVVLLDLGIVLDSRRARSTVVGSGIPGDPRTLSRPAFTCDVYQVGLLVLFMLTGVDSARRSPRSGFEDLFRRLPLPFVALARRALDTDSAARFSSAAAMKVAVEAALEMEPKHENEAAPRERERDAPTTTMTVVQLLSLMADSIPTFDRVRGDDDETPKT